LGILQRRVCWEYTSRRRVFYYYYKLNLNFEFSYWLGLENLYYMTNNHNAKLRVDFYDPGLTPTTVYGIFSTFKISSEADKYRSLFSGLLKIFNLFA